jgi:AraC family transcriptional regulator of arabinose operon
MKHFDKPNTYGEIKSEGIVAGHFLEKDSYTTKRPHGMKDSLITLTLGGEGYFITQGKEHICRAGDVVVMKGSYPHQYGTTRGQVWNFVWSHFSPNLFEVKFLPDEPLFIYSVENDYSRKRIYRTFQKVIQDSRERNEYWHELCQNSLREIFLLLAQMQNKKNDSRIEQVLHLLSVQMQDALRIEDLARSVGLSPSRLSHLFKQNVGSSIVETLNEMRLNQAALLFEHTERTAMEISLDVGFQNYNHFANLFRKHFGMNPSSYKKIKSR